jgi:hypothetical protein
MVEQQLAAELETEPPPNTACAIQNRGLVLIRLPFVVETSLRGHG